MKLKNQKPTDALEKCIVKQAEILKEFQTEFYDNIGPILCLAKINIKTINLSDASKSNEILEESGDLIQKAINDLRILASQAKNSQATELL